MDAMQRAYARGTRLLRPEDFLVRLDIAIPKVDGWHVAQQLRRLCNEKRPLIIAVSGYGMEADRLRFQDWALTCTWSSPWTQSNWRAC